MVPGSGALVKRTTISYLKVAASIRDTESDLLKRLRWVPTENGSVGNKRTTPDGGYSGWLDRERRGLAASWDTSRKCNSH